MKKPAIFSLLLFLSFTFTAQVKLHANVLSQQDPSKDQANKQMSQAAAIKAEATIPETHQSGPVVAKRHGVPNKAYSVRGGVSYTTSNGIRLSNQEVGISAKHFFKSNEALQGILSTGWPYAGGRITGLYVVQRPIGSEGFFWFWGLGAHAGYFKGNYWTGNNQQETYLSNGEWYSPASNRLTMGLSGTIGIEYHFAEAPFTVAIDLKPSLDLLGMSPRYGDAAFSLSYAF